MLQIWGRRSALNVQKVMWLVGELNLPYQAIPAGGSEGGLDAPAFLAMNPHGRIPVVVDAGLPIWESHTILRYLAARYGAASFWPDDAGQRSQSDRWMDWAQTTLQPDFITGVFWGYYRTPEPQRDGPAIASSLARCARHFQLLDTVLQDRAFLCGDQLTLADICTGTALYRYFELPIERLVLPHLLAWYERLQARPAYREHVMIPFTEMRGRLDF